MKRKEAVEFHEELKRFMEEQAVRLGLEKGAGADLVDQYIDIYPDELPVMGILDLGDKGSTSVKPGNVLVNQKKILLAACADWIISFAIPKGVLNHIQLCLCTGIAFYTSMKVELDENESYVVAYLHSHQMYDRGDQEIVFYTNFPVWYRRQTGDEISDKRLEKAVNNLLELKSIQVEDGEIRLKEKVWRNKLTE